MNSVPVGMQLFSSQTVGPSHCLGSGGPRPDTGVEMTWTECCYYDTLHHPSPGDGRDKVLVEAGEALLCVSVVTRLQKPVVTSLSLRFFF